MYDSALFNKVTNCALGVHASGGAGAVGGGASGGASGDGASGDGASGGGELCGCDTNPVL